MFSSRLDRTNHCIVDALVDDSDPAPSSLTPCPLQEGVFQMTFDMGDGIQCEEDLRSNATIAGSAISLFSCSTEPPSYGEFITQFHTKQ